MGPDYVTGLAMETLIVTTGRATSHGPRRPPGKRLAIAIETEEGRRLAESKVKPFHRAAIGSARASCVGTSSSSSRPISYLIVGNHKPLRSAMSTRR